MDNGTGLPRVIGVAEAEAVKMVRAEVARRAQVAWAERELRVTDGQCLELRRQWETVMLQMDVAETRRYMLEQFLEEALEGQPAALRLRRWARASVGSSSGSVASGRVVGAEVQDTEVGGSVMLWEALEVASDLGSVSSHVEVEGSQEQCAQQPRPCQ